MGNENRAILLLWAVCIFVIAWAGYEAFRLAQVILPTLVAGFATLLTAILTHALTQAREYELKRRQLMQENYRQIVELITPFIRNPGLSRDQLDTARMLSWVVGTQSVITATQQFVNQPNTDTLADLLAAMRADIGYPAVSREFAPNVLNPVPPPPSLPKGERPLLTSREAEPPAEPIEIGPPPAPERKGFFARYFR
jgi:hypothetical protein